MTETLFALTNDDAGGQEPESFAALLDFLAEQQVPATFFVIPLARGEPLDKKREWLPLLRRALDEGHELQLHDLTHADFEFGVPPDFMLDIMPGGLAKARWQHEPDLIRQGHTVEILSDKIARGKEIFYRALGYEPQGFRAGCLAICDNMYQALAHHNIQWSSNLVVNPMGWRYISRQYEADEPWQKDIPPHPFPYQARVIEVPMLSEYTWFLKEEDLERHFNLIKDDYDRVRQLSGTFVTLSHYYAMVGEWSTALQVYKRLFAYAREQGEVRFCTISQLLESYV